LFAWGLGAGLLGRCLPILSRFFVFEKINGFAVTGFVRLDF